MKKLILHLGFQKTGSTSLQALLDINRARLSDIDLYVYGQDTIPVRNTCQSAIGNPTPAALKIVKYIFSGLFQEMIETPNETVIFSDENVLGRVLYTSSGHILEWAELLLPIMASAMPDEIEPRIVFYTREQDGWLKSLYGQSVKRAQERRRFETWKADRPLQTDWAHMKARLTAAASGIPVDFVSMEEDLAEFGFLGGRLLEISGVERARIDTLELSEPRNKALSPLALGLMRVVNHAPLGRRRLTMISERVEAWDNRRSA